MRSSRIFIAYLTASLAATITVSRNLRLNVTSSLPRGIYRTVSGAPNRGSTVIACLPPAVSQFARSRRYVWGGDCPGGSAPIGKLVAATAGDTIIVTAEGIVVNGFAMKNTRVLPQDSKGRPLKHFLYGAYVVPPGSLWLASTYSSLSYDSRYFGFISLASVRDRIEPLWVVTDRSMVLQLSHERR